MPTPQLWFNLPPKNAVEMTTHGEYERGYPRGAIVHYSAGASMMGALNVAIDHQLAYFVIGQDGEIRQRAPLNRWGSHAGESFWPSLGAFVSRHLVGIEVVCAGMVTAHPDGRFTTWWGSGINFNDVNLIYDASTDSNRSANDNRAPGFYARFTARQESALTDLLIWLKQNNPDVFDLGLVLGHDEVSPGRKMDPGGSLSMSMPEFRGHLDREYRMRK